MPPCGVLEAARLLAHGAGERALLVAEQLALEQVLGQRAAVHLDPRPGRAAAREVDRAREQVLAGAALAAQQHGRIGGRHLARQLERLRERRASRRRWWRARGVSESTVPASRAVVGAQRPLAGGRREDALQLLAELALLVDVVVGADA